MRNVLAVVMVLGLSASCGGGVEAVKPNPVPYNQGAVEEVAAGGNAFAFDLYGHVRETEGNLFLSPFSISTALAMTYAGAAGDTAAEMESVLHLPHTPEQTHLGYSGLMYRLRTPKKPVYELHVANALWPQQGYAFEEAFLKVARDQYSAGVETVDYINGAEQARKRINAWVEAQTKKKIRDLIQPGLLTSATRLVLTNAIYFKGTWAEEFKKTRTKDKPFHLTATDAVNVPTMHQTGIFQYAETDSARILEMPYKGHELSMVILLPKTLEGLPELERTLSAENLASWLRNKETADVEVSLPRFQTTCEFRLSDVLQAMGMRLAFSTSADFSKTTQQEEFFIDEVVHKAYVDVYEKGTEAAAATGVIEAEALAAPTGPKVFRADHPFVFLIQDTRTGAVLFLGRIIDPRS
ncbi:MAG: serpin family protein [bacterium]|nr:serpin family protein [bacterium]